MPDDDIILRNIDNLFPELEIVAGTLGFNNFPESTISSIDFVLNHLMNVLEQCKGHSPRLETALGSLAYALRVILTNLRQSPNPLAAKADFKNALEKFRNVLTERTFFQKTNIRKLQEIIRML